MGLVKVVTSKQQSPQHRERRSIPTSVGLDQTLLEASTGAGTAVPAGVEVPELVVVAPRISAKGARRCLIASSLVVEGAETRIF